MECNKCNGTGYTLDKELEEIICDCDDSIQTLEEFPYVSFATTGNSGKILGKLKL